MRRVLTWIGAFFFAVLVLFVPSSASWADHDASHGVSESSSPSDGSSSPGLEPPPPSTTADPEPVPSETPSSTPEPTPEPSSSAPASSESLSEGACGSPELPCIVTPSSELGAFLAVVGGLLACAAVASLARMFGR